MLPAIRLPLVNLLASLSVFFGLGMSFGQPVEACSADFVPFVPATPLEAARYKKKMADMTALGRKLFSDTRLSASRRMACATCHDAMHAYGPPDASGVKSGGPSLDRPGTRAVPSLRYMQTTPNFIEHAIGDEDFNLGEDVGPVGGHAWDGRVNSLHEQAVTPLFAPHEMANGTPARFASRLRKAGYAKEFRRFFGKNIFKDSPQVLAQTAMALEIFQESAEDFYPFTSKFDAFLRGKAKLNELETRGMDLFNDPEKGNCFFCHNSQTLYNGKFTHPQFTDYGYAALGVPRNDKIVANRNSDYFDLGLCGPDRKDLTQNADYCGQFKVPSLRNVATRHSFFHNGVFSSLKEVLEFYVDRDIHPERWYKQADGTVKIYDDLPENYHRNVNREAPFDRKAGEEPRLSANDIKDLIAFLETLTDGYQLQDPLAKKVAQRKD